VGSENPVEWSQKAPYFVHEGFSANPPSLLGLVVHDFNREHWKVLPELKQSQAAGEFLKRQPGLWRVHKDPQESEFNLGDWMGIEQTTGYGGVTADVFSIYGTKAFERPMGARYAVSRKTLDRPPIYEGPGGWKVYELAGAEVELRYRPAPVDPGGALFALGLALLLINCWARRTTGSRRTSTSSPAATP